MDPPKPLVYIIAPFTKPDPIENTHRAIEVGERLRADGIVTPLVPHLCLAWHLTFPRPPEVWYRYTLELAAWAHASLRIPGESSGGDREEAWFTEHKVPVFRLSVSEDLAVLALDDLYRWVRNVWPSVWAGRGLAR
jgi:hypothetical protein